MSKTVTKNKWDGGHAEDIRTLATDECDFSLNFNLFENPYRLTPYGDSIAETSSTAVIADSQITDIDVSLIGSTYILTGVGNESDVSSKPTFYIKSALTNGGTLNWTNQATAAANTYVKNSGIVYKNKMYALAFSGTVYTLYRYDSAGTVTSCGTITDSSTFRAKPFVHPDDNKLYIVTGNTISYYDGVNAIGTSVATSYSVSTILPTGFEAVSQTSSGAYLAIAMRPLRGNGNTVTFLWGRDATLNTLQGRIDFGEGNLIHLENLNNTLFAVMQPNSSVIDFATIQNKLEIRAWAGGSVQTVKSIPISSNTATVTITKAKNRERLFFGFPSDDCVYAFGKNKSGQYIVTKDRYYFNGTTIGTSFTGLSFVGEILWRAFTTVGGVFTLMRSKILSGLGETISYNATSVYRTTINPNMPVEDRYDHKQLEAVQLSYIGKASGTAVLKYSIDGGAFTTIISDSTTAVTTATEATNELDGTVFGSGNEIVFQIESTGGVEIVELKYRYSVLNSQL